MSKTIDTVTVSKLKNGYLISPAYRHPASYDDCIIVEGFDVARLAEAVANMLATEVKEEK